MNNPSQPNITNGSGRTADRAAPSAPGSRRPTLGKSPRKQNPKETAQEAVHQVMPKDAVKAPSTATDAVNPPLRAAKGDDDLMSQPVKRS
jgi:hypothetical protein